VAGEVASTLIRTPFVGGSMLELSLLIGLMADPSQSLRASASPTPIDDVNSRGPYWTTVDIGQAPVDRDLQQVTNSPFAALMRIRGAGADA
jgi:hypothetical protein